MTWKFELIAGPYQGPCGGLAWDGQAMLFSVVDEGRIMRFDPETNAVNEFRRYTNRVNGLGIGPSGELYGCQEGGRRVIQFMPDGPAVPTATRLGGQVHNYPCDIIADRTGRLWFSDPYHAIPTVGAQIFPPLDHASILRLERDNRRIWKIKRVTNDNVVPRAVLLSPDEATLYVSDGDGSGTRACTLRSYPVHSDGSVGQYNVMHAFGVDHRGAHRGIEGMCRDSEGNIVACAGWNKSGPGPLIYVFSPKGAVLETHPLPADVPMRCAFGDSDLASLYVTTGDGRVYRAKAGGRLGFRWPNNQST